MKNKNGFIATSVMFAFFLVFVSLSTLVITSYAHYDSLINALNGNILETLNSDIRKKYIHLTNCVVNGDLSDSSSYWNLTGSSVFHDSVYNNNYIRVTAGSNATISQNFNGCMTQREGVSKKKIYVRYRVNVSNFNCASSVTLTYDGNKNILTNLCAMDASRFVNWENRSFIIDANNVNSANQAITFSISSTSGNYLGLEEIIVTDITKLYKDESCLNTSSCDNTIKTELDARLPYFGADGYSLEKI